MKKRFSYHLKCAVREISKWNKGFNILLFLIFLYFSVFHFLVSDLIFMKIKRLIALQAVFCITTKLLQDKRQVENSPHCNRNELKLYPEDTDIAIQAQYILNAYLTSRSYINWCICSIFSCMNGNFEGLFIFTNTAHR